jgi:hypothetical protein
MGSIRSMVLHVNIIVLTGFGTWTVKEKKSRNGRNPQTGEAMLLDERCVVNFKASPEPLDPEFDQVFYDIRDCVQDRFLTCLGSVQVRLV